MNKREPIRILRIIARLNIGGPAIQAVSLSRHFSEGGYRSLLVCGQVGLDEGDMSYLARESGVRPFMLSSLGREISALDDLKTLYALRAVIKRFRPHIIHTHTAKAGTLGRVAGIWANLFRGRKDRIRLVHTFHGHIFHSYFGRLKTFVFVRIERLLARFTDQIIVISPRQKSDICERFKIARPDKVRIIPLGFDLSGFGTEGPRDAEMGGEPRSDDVSGRLRVGIVGRLTRVKNHRMLLDAVRILRDRGEDGHFRFFVVGDGELREDLMRYAGYLEIEQSVVFTGWRKDMPAVYRGLDILVLTSLNEGTPVTLIEAMAAAKPVVATDVGGVRDLLGTVDKETDEGYKLTQKGILISSENAEALAEALVYLSRNREASTAMARRAREFAMSRYSLDRLRRDLDSLYKELSTAHRGAQIGTPGENPGHDGGAG